MIQKLSIRVSGIDFFSKIKDILFNKFRTNFFYVEVQLMKKPHKNSLLKIIVRWKKAKTDFLVEQPV